MSALATVAGKSINGKSYCKNWFSDRVFHVTIADADIGSIKFLHTLFDKYLDHAGEIWTNTYGPNYAKCWAFWRKMVNHFWQSVDAILEDVSVTKTIVWCWTINLKIIIFHCSKNYGSPTRVTRLKEDVPIFTCLVFTFSW